jgi:hypothetical protein
MNPMGDLAFSLQQGEKPICVSSEVLSAASPVFKAMLSPRWREGQELATNWLVKYLSFGIVVCVGQKFNRIFTKSSIYRATGQITELALGYHDAEALEFLIIAIHAIETILRLDIPEFDMDYSSETASRKFRRLQEVSNKYQCGLSLPTIFLQHLLRILSDPGMCWSDAAWEILDISHEFGLVEIVRRTSKLIMERDRGEIREKLDNWKPEHRFPSQMYCTSAYPQLMCNHLHMSSSTNPPSRYGGQGGVDPEDHRLGNRKLVLL